MKKTLFISAMALLSSSAFAQMNNGYGLSYNEIGFGYSSQKVAVSGTPKTFNGYGLSASALMTDIFYLNAGYANINRTESGTKTTLGQTNLGLGFRMPVYNDTDFNATIGISSTSVTASDSMSGYALGLGLRSLAISPDVESSVKYVYQHSKQGTYTTNKNGLALGLKYKITGHFNLNGDYFSAKDANITTLGLGYRF